MKSKLNKIKSEIKKAALYNQENNETNIKIISALNKGKKSVSISFTEFGIEFNNTYNLADMLDSLIPTAYININNFISKPNKSTYNDLINSFFIDVMADISSQQFTEHITGSRFDTDACLTTLVSMTYLSEKLQEKTINKLAFLKHKQIEEYEIATFYSANTLLPMIYHFYTQHHHSRKFPITFDNIEGRKNKRVSENIYQNLTPLYKNAIENYDNNIDVFSKIIYEMCDYHIKNSKDNYFLEFNNLQWQYFPIEILFLLKERHKKGLSIDGINHPLIDDFLPYFLNDFEISEQNRQILELVLENSLHQ